MKKYIVAGGIIGIALIGFGGYFFTHTHSVRPAAPLDAFARCLKDKGVLFYGAFWCPHCQNEKKMFGDSAQYLPYVECSTQDGKSQTQVCIDKKIQGYPTWIYPDGRRESGELSPAHLAEKTGCTLPE